MKQKKITLSVIIPVYNEEQRVSLAFRELCGWKPGPQIAVEKVIFVDDGSSDGTVLQIKKAKKLIEKSLKTTVSIISYKPNTGAGYAIKKGMAASTSDYTFFFDVDMAVPLSEFIKCLPALKQGKDLIIGTRNNKESQVLVEQPKYRAILGQTYIYLTNIVLNTWVDDFNCGFKLFSRKAKDLIFPHIASNGWGFHAESIYLATRMKFSIKQIPVIWIDKKGSKVNIFIDAPRSFKELVMIRLRHGIAAVLPFSVKYNLVTK
jgi:dolichyl-phosphate beta-glucosyltransferase